MLKESLSAAYLEDPLEHEAPRFHLEGAGAWSIGRGPQNAVVLHDERVSRNHALIQRTAAAEFFLMDLGSSNGSFVNGRRASVPTPLQDGDKISMGGREMIFRNPQPRSEQPAPAPEGGERSTQLVMDMQLVSVLVTDIRDFTALSRRVEPAILSRTLSTLNRKAAGILESYGSWGQKYIGDAVMAVWLHREPQQLAVEIMCILRAVCELAALTASLPARFGLSETLRIGAGINTGYAPVGNIGSSHFSDHTAIGEVVNRAFRLESATKEMGLDIALAPETFDILGAVPLASERFQARQVQLKGYEEPMPTYGISFENLRTLLGTPTTAVAGL